MAIQNFCLRCAYAKQSSRDGVRCSFLGKRPVYDGVSCSHFEESAIGAQTYATSSGVFVGGGQLVDNEMCVNDRIVCSSCGRSYPADAVCCPGCKTPNPSSTVQMINEQCEDNHESENKKVTARSMVGLSSVRQSITVMAVMCTPILILSIVYVVLTFRIPSPFRSLSSDVDWWVIIIRFVVAILCGLLAIWSAHKADKYEEEGNMKKAVKRAKEAKGSNIILILYSIGTIIYSIKSIAALAEAISIINQTFGIN